MLTRNVLRVRLDETLPLCRVARMSGRADEAQPQGGGSVAISDNSPSLGVGALLPLPSCPGPVGPGGPAVGTLPPPPDGFRRVHIEVRWTGRKVPLALPPACVVAWERRHLQIRRVA